MSFTHQIQAEVLADSLSPEGSRLTSMLVTYNRFIIAEVDTHRVFSRNSGSSRAIPFTTMLERAEQHPAPFVEYPCEQPGMSGGALLEGDDLEDALRLLEDIQAATIERLRDYLDRHPDRATRLHKSCLNRTLEWFGWTTTVITSSEWDNFFRQRAHPAAQPEFRELAYKMQDALRESVPTPLDYFQWHLPFLTDERDAALPSIERPKVSAARCARTSLLTHDDEFSHEADLRLYYETLAKYGHWSPLEHPAVCLSPSFGLQHYGNFDRPWYQLRHMVEYDDTGATLERVIKGGESS